MSIQRLRQLKLYKKLQRDFNYRQKLQQKIKEISSKNPSVQSFKITRKLNNNKKYLQQEQRNAEIQRENRILFQKIQSQNNKLNQHRKQNSKIRSSKTLNKYADQNSQIKQRNHYNRSQNKIHYLNQQSRISFQQNQQLLKPKNYKNRKMFTEQAAQIFQSRIIENKIASNQMILFQGISEIDSIRFKIKIFIKDKVYCLSGKNKHTDILLKMELNQYRKFHKQVLMGNPSNIFPYLIIDKGQIKFRTQQEPIEIKQKIYKIEEEDQQSQQLYKKYKQMKKKNHYKKQSQSSEANKIDGNYSPHLRPNQNYYQQRFERNNYEDDNHRNKNKAYYDYKNSRNDSRHEKASNSTEKIRKKQNISSNIPNQKSRMDSYDKHRILEDYINQNHHYEKNPLKSGDSTQVQVKNIKNRYKLPYL